jgi:hypothetical protein
MVRVLPIFKRLFTLLSKSNAWRVELKFSLQIDNCDFNKLFNFTALLQMANRSLIYRNIGVYRFLMNLLYLGKYKRRFSVVADHLKNLPHNSRILELCFGDTYIADHCRQVGYYWKGIDLNNEFVKYARKAGYDAEQGDVLLTDTLPKADVCVMIGSFYHFFEHSAAMLEKMFSSAPVVIISEPVVNLSSRKDLIGFLARRLANAGKGNEKYRFTESTLLEMVNKSSQVLNFRISDVQQNGKDLVIKLIHNATH